MTKLENDMRHPYNPLIDIILVNASLLILLALAYFVNLPLWITGSGALIVILVFCVSIIWRYQHDVAPDVHFAPDGLEELPGLQDHAEATRRTI